MKFHTIVRTQWLVTGLGAALLLAPSLNAQDITNTEFDDGPYVVPFSDTVSTEGAAVAASTPVMTESQALQAMAAISAPSIPDEANLIQVSAVERWITLALLVIASLLAVFILVELSVLVELKRARRSLPSAHNPRVSTRTA
jgi:hypothetical protein